MKKLILASLFAVGTIIGIEAAPTDNVTQADLQAIIERLNKLEAENKAQAKKIAELEGKNKALAAKAEQPVVAKQAAGEQKVAVDEGTEVSESGRVYTTGDGKKYYLADATAKIFEPLSESGLQVTPYGYLVLEGVYSDRELDADWSTDFVSRNSGNRNHTTLSVQDSILGIKFVTPEAYSGWKFSGKAEFDLAGSTQNDYAFHWRHLYVDAAHESGWSVLFGQTWHLWKMVTPNEIDGAWMENAGHPYRRSPQIRVTKKWDWQENGALEWRFGIVKGGPGMGEDRDRDGIQDNTASAWALFETALIYDRATAWESNGRRWLVGFGGMYGKDRSHRLVAPGVYGGEEDEYDSMMAMFAAQIPFGKFTLTGQIYGGQNLGGVQAGCGQTVYYHDFNQAGDAVRTLGGFVDLAYDFNEKWSAAIGYGFDDPNDDDVKGGVSGKGWPSPGVLWNDRAYIAAFYRITPNCKFGLEYARLLTCYDEGATDGDYGANRVQFTAFYDF